MLICLVVFNEFNARSIDNNMDVFRGLFQNPIFLCIIVITVASQYGIVEYGGDFVKTTSLSAEHWYMSVLISSFTLPMGAIMRMVPISDSNLDFAPLSPLLEAFTPKANSSKKESHAFTHFLWFVTVSAVVGVVCRDFFIPYGDAIGKCISNS